MLQILEFIFSSFWVWFGTFILISAIGSAVAEIIGGIRSGKS